MGASLLRGAPRITAAKAGAASAITPAGKTAAVESVATALPQPAAGPTAALPRPMATPSISAQEQAFAPAAARRGGSREERQTEGPRLSIGLLEVQIIQEAAEAPQAKMQSHNPAHERDELERSYIRSIG